MRFRSATLVVTTAAVLGALSAVIPARVDTPVPLATDPARHSPLDEINKSNVGTLEVAWTYRIDDANPKAFSTIECTPLLVDDALYITSARGKVIALDAATGRERWVFDPVVPAPGRFQVAGGVNRGVAAWRDQAAGRLRIFHGTADGRLLALDGADGRPVAAFGEAGAVDLGATLPEEFAGRRIGMTSPPLVIDDLVVAGVSVGEGPDPAASGDILAFDARSGRLRWRFHTVPRPGELGHETWEDGSWRGRGGVNAWSGLSADPARGLIFAATGSAAFDFYGGDRKGDNLFANSTIAIEARTGRRVWHFQTVRHDVWDYDLPTPPLLVRVTRNGRQVDAVAQVTKTGFVYVFDRETGTPLFDIVERPAPASDVPGERTAATQPVPAAPPPFIRQTFTEADVHGVTPEAKTAALERFKQLRHDGLFAPPSLAGTIALPGTRGGATWSGASFDPATGWLYVSANEIANVLTLVRRDDARMPYGLKAYEQFLDAEGYPAIRPPWGTVSAIDLNAGRIVWQVPLGEHPELVERGFRNTGTENFGGTIVTAGGLVFIGGAKDERFRAYDAATGEQLWSHQLEAGGYATPATYRAGGRQLVVIAAGGGGKPRTKSGTAFVAFGLPRKG